MKILRIFDWMGRKQRDFFPKKFTASTKRPWDNYFWWVEIDGLESQFPHNRGTFGRGVDQCQQCRQRAIARCN